MTEYDKLIADMKDEFPKFQVIDKKDSLMMKAINIFLKIITFGQMKTFMTHFTTTVGYRMYVSSRWLLADQVGVVKHERVHMRQMRRHGKIWHALSYLFLWTPCVFAHFRKKYEQEAYEESMRHRATTYGLKHIKGAEYREGIISNFTSAKYFWTWPFRKSIETWYDATVQKISDEIVNG
jgi:hypothetical protein